MPKRSRAERHGDGSARRRLLGWLGLSCLVLLFFAGSLIWTMPASVLFRFVERPPQIEHVSGRILAGEAVLDGGYVLNWRADWPGWAYLPFAWTLAGPDTRVAGTVRLMPGAADIRDAQGRAGPGLLALVGPLVCDASASVDVARLAWFGDRAAADGEILIREGTCARGEQTAPVPAIRFALETRDANAVATAVRIGDGEALGQVAVTGARTLDILVEPAGAALIPGLPAGGPIQLSLPF